MITAEPTEQGLRGQRTKTLAVWSAIERACRDEDFRPKTGPLCKFCRFRDFCPAYGGDPSLAAAALGGDATGRGVSPGRPDERRRWRRVALDGEVGVGSPGTGSPRRRRPSVDDRVDAPVRAPAGPPAVDTAAKVITALGDHGWLWTGVAVWRGRRSGPSTRAGRPGARCRRGLLEPRQRRHQAGGGPGTSRRVPTCASPNTGVPVRAAEDEQLPERAHAGRLLLGRRAQPSRRPDGATPSSTRRPASSA